MQAPIKQYTIIEDFSKIILTMTIVGHYMLTLPILIITIILVNSVILYLDLQIPHITLTIKHVEISMITPIGFMNFTINHIVIPF
jgi:hypothetical protein